MQYQIVWEETIPWFEGGLILPYNPNNLMYKDG